MSQSRNFRIPTSSLTLDYPLSLGVYEKYEQAQQAVDFLSDNEFPVQNCLIVGTDLKQVERVTGRLTNGKVAAGGLLSGLWMGLFVGLVVSLFGSGGTFAIIVSTMLFGAVFGLVWAMAGYLATRGQRDFTSVSQVVANPLSLSKIVKMMPMKMPSHSPESAPPRATLLDVRRPVIRSTCLRSVPTIRQFCTGNSLSERKSTACWACSYFS